MKKNIFLLIVSIWISSCSNKTLPAPEGLLVELLRYPEKAVITDSIPEFGWIFPTVGVKQIACRILVSSSLSLLNEDDADYWDSDKVITSASINFSYNGKPLLPNKSYWWKVKTWDKEGNESEYSTSQQFHTSKFINNDDAFPGKSDYVQLANKIWVSEDRETSTFNSRKPIQFKNVSNGKWFADFGNAAFGTLELTINSIDNSESVELFLGERKNKDLTVNKNSGRSNIGFEKASIKLKKGLHDYIVKIPPHHSNAPNTQKLPPFSLEVLPFRYVEINGNGENVEVKDLKQKALYYPFDDTASAFESSDTTLNSVWELCKYTLKATPFLGLYADGNRERMPYEADSYIQQLGHYCVDREFSIGRYTTNFLIYNPSWPTEWNMHIILMAWQDYMHTGNKEFLSKMYTELKNKTLIALSREDGLISTKTGKVTPEFLNSINIKGGIQDIVDWPKGTAKGSEQAGNAGPTPEGERDGYVFREINTVVNSFHYHALVLMSNIAEILEKKEDKMFFRIKSDLVKKSILEKLFNNKRGIFVDGESTDHSSLHANMFPLAFNIVPPEHAKNVVKFIKSKGMACSVYGAQYLLDALYNAGEANYALSLMTSKSKRSWLNMINVGSTMTTEAWDEYYKPNLTWNHAWGSAPANIIPRRLLGIEPIVAGFEKFRILPQPGKLKEMKLKLPSIRGTIACDLSVKKTGWKMEVTVPGNSRAELWLPAIFTKVRVNLESRIPDWDESFAGSNRNVFELTSGTYTIIAEW